MVSAPAPTLLQNSPKGQVPGIAFNTENMHTQQWTREGERAGQRGRAHSAAMTGKINNQPTNPSSSASEHHPVPGLGFPTLQL